MLNHSAHTEPCLGISSTTLHYSKSTAHPYSTENAPYPQCHMSTVPHRTIVLHLRVLVKALRLCPRGSHASQCTTKQTWYIRVPYTLHKNPYCSIMHCCSRLLHGQPSYTQSWYHSLRGLPLPRPLSTPESYIHFAILSPSISSTWPNHLSTDK